MTSHKSPSSARYWAAKETREILETRRAVSQAKKEISHHWVSDSGVSGFGSAPMGRDKSYWHRTVRAEVVIVRTRV